MEKPVSTQDACANGGDSLRRRVSLTNTALSAPTVPSAQNALGESTVPARGPQASLAASVDDLGLFAGTGGVVGPFTVFDEYGGESSHEWAGPLVFVVAGSILILIAHLIARRRRTVIPAAELLYPPRVHQDPPVPPPV